MYGQGLNVHRCDPSLVLGQARIHELLNDAKKAFEMFRQVMLYDNNNVESLASIASYHFYTDQPEVALRFYKRLVECGMNSAELWNNMGLCCYYASQYDMALTCFERALSMADDQTLSEIWFNIGHVGIGIGDLGLAYQAFKVSISFNGNHAESYNNLGVLELRKGNAEQAKTNFQQAARASGFLFEPLYNVAYLFYKRGEFQ